MADETVESNTVTVIGSSSLYSKQVTSIPYLSPELLQTLVKEVGTLLWNRFSTASCEATTSFILFICVQCYVGSTQRGAW